MLAQLQLLQQQHAESPLAFDFETSDSGIDLYFPQVDMHFQHSFLVGAFARRAQQSNQALLKACSNKQATIKTVLDMTAGTGSAAAAQLSLQQAHARDFLQPSNDSFDCIYLDPMFPPHKSSAKPAKAMQLLQSLTENLDMDACVELALQKAGNRVVIKRPAKASALVERKADLVYREKTVRFDVYLTK